MMGVCWDWLLTHIHYSRMEENSVQIKCPQTIDWFGNCLVLGLSLSGLCRPPRTWRGWFRTIFKKKSPLLPPLFTSTKPKKLRTKPFFFIFFSLAQIKRTFTARLINFFGLMLYCIEASFPYICSRSPDLQDPPSQHGLTDPFWANNNLVLVVAGASLYLCP